MVEESGWQAVFQRVAEELAKIAQVDPAQDSVPSSAT
jgi:hypothetical protein